MAKLTLTTIVKKADECIIYTDNGIVATWTDKQKFNFDVIAETKKTATGLVMLVTEEEAQAFTGNKYHKLENHEAWTLPRYIIWNVYGKMETDEDDVKLVEFIKEHLI